LPRSDARAARIAAAEQVVAANRLSARTPPLSPRGGTAVRARGWLLRLDSQFHWHNEGFGSFDDFLATLSSRKRKTIRKERAAALTGSSVEHVTGSRSPSGIGTPLGLLPGYRHPQMGRPYLTRRFFSLLGERMADRLLLVFALHGGEPIAGR
jgi:predicted N-acyltransferase